MSPSHRCFLPLSFPLALPLSFPLVLKLNEKIPSGEDCQKHPNIGLETAGALAEPPGVGELFPLEQRLDPGPVGDGGAAA